jgi:hypothetical protein
VPAEEQKKMVETNAARLFKIDVTSLDIPDSCIYVP